MEKKLISFSSNYIKSYIKKNPVDMMDSSAWMARRGGPGDRYTPSLAVAVFYDLLQVKESLFTQCEFFNYAIQYWDKIKPDWYKNLEDDEREGIRVRLARQFYPAAIDQIFVQSLLIESSFFNRVKYVSRQEVTGVDIVTYTKIEREIKVGLAKDTAKSYEPKKNDRRGYCSLADFNVYKPTKEREVSEGNFVWYELGDFADVLKLAIEDSRSNAKQPSIYL